MGFCDVADLMTKARKKRSKRSNKSKELEMKTIEQVTSKEKLLKMFYRMFIQVIFCPNIIQKCPIFTFYTQF